MMQEQELLSCNQHLETNREQVEKENTPETPEDQIKIFTNDNNLVVKEPECRRSQSPKIVIENPKMYEDAITAGREKSPRKATPEKSEPEKSLQKQMTPERSPKKTTPEKISFLKTSPIKTTPSKVTPTKITFGKTKCEELVPEKLSRGVSPDKMSPEKRKHEKSPVLETKREKSPILDIKHEKSPNLETKQKESPKKVTPEKAVHEEITEKESTALSQKVEDNVESKNESSESDRKLGGKYKRRASVVYKPTKKESPRRISVAVAEKPKKDKFVEFDNTEYQDWIKFSVADQVFVMGQGDTGQLGLGDSVEEKSPPTKVNLGKLKFKQAVCGSMHTLILTDDGNVYSCGCNDENALGRATSSGDEFLFKKIKFSEKIVKVCAGDSFSAALTENGHVYAWGLFRDSNGPIGMVDGTPKATPVLIYSEKDACANIASGCNHLIILTKSGRVFSCGSGDEGQLGRLGERYVVSRGGRRSISLLVTPREVFFPFGSTKPRKGDFSRRIVRIFAAKNISFAQLLDGSIFGWGLNNYNQLSPKEEMFIFYPETLTHIMEVGPTDEPLEIKITGGVNHVLVLNKKSGIIFSGGHSDDGALGRVYKNKEEQSDKDLLPVEQGNVKFKDCACGDGCSFAISRDDKLYSWGLGCNQQLGFEKEDDVKKPTQVSSLKDLKVVQASSGSQHSILLCTQ